MLDDDFQVCYTYQNKSNDVAWLLMVYRHSAMAILYYRL